MKRHDSQTWPNPVMRGPEVNSLSQANPVAAAAKLSRLPSGDSSATAPHRDRWARGFFGAVAAFLALTGGVRLWSVLPETRVLGAPAPLWNWLTALIRCLTARLGRVECAQLLQPSLVSKLGWARGGPRNFSRHSTSHRVCIQVTFPEKVVAQVFGYNHRLGAAAILLLGGLMTNAKAHAERVVSNYTYREYQAAMPYIRRIVFEHWDKKKYGPGYFWAEGAFQPQGWFLLYPTNSPYTTNLVVTGLSADFEWSYGAEWSSVSYGPRDVWDQWGKSITCSEMRILLSAAYLGIPRLPGDFTWRNDTEFDFFVSGWGKCIGRIVRSDGERPLEVVYAPVQSGAYPKGRVTYFYHGNRTFPPDSFHLTWEWANGIEEMRFVWRQLELGLDPAASRGYQLNSFLRTTNEVREVHFFSNLVRYVMLPNGTLKPYQYSQPPPPQRSSVSVAAGVALIVVIIPAGILLFRQLRRK